MRALANVKTFPEFVDVTCGVIAALTADDRRQTGIYVSDLFSNGNRLEPQGAYAVVKALRLCHLIQYVSDEGGIIRWHPKLSLPAPVALLGHLVALEAVACTAKLYPPHQ